MATTFRSAGQLRRVGRPLWNINPSCDIPNFQASVLKVISSETSVETYIPVRDGATAQLRILPYRTLEGSVDGAVITMQVPPEALRAANQEKR